MQTFHASHLEHVRKRYVAESLGISNVSRFLLRVKSSLRRRSLQQRIALQSNSGHDFDESRLLEVHVLFSVRRLLKHDERRGMRLFGCVGVSGLDGEHVASRPSDVGRLSFESSGVVQTRVPVVFGVSSVVHRDSFRFECDRRFLLQILVADHDVLAKLHVFRRPTEGSSLVCVRVAYGGGRVDRSVDRRVAIARGTLPRVLVPDSRGGFDGVRQSWEPSSF